MSHAAFGGMDGIGILGANWAKNVRETLRKMGLTEMADLVVGFLQVRIWKGVMMVMRPVAQIAADHGIKLENGGIKMIDDYGNEFIFNDDSVIFTKSMVKDHAFFATWKELVDYLFVNEVMATSVHWQYNKIRMNRQFFELMMSQATDTEIRDVVSYTAKQIRDVGIGRGYVREALRSIPEWGELASMR